MSKYIFFSALIGCTLLFTACQQTPEPKPTTAVELSKMNRDFVKALNAKDAVAAANCYSEDATLLPPNEAPVKGRANIQKYWEGMWNTDTLALK